MTWMTDRRSPPAQRMRSSSWRSRSRVASPLARFLLAGGEEAASGRRFHMRSSDGSILQNSSLALVHPSDGAPPPPMGRPPPSTPLRKALRVLALSSGADGGGANRSPSCAVQICLTERQSGMFAGKWVTRLRAAALHTRSLCSGFMEGMMASAQLAPPFTPGGSAQ